MICIGIILGASLQFVRAWVEPTSAPPGDNVGAPITTGKIGQVKDGALGVGLTVKGSNPGLIVYGGRVGVGTDDPLMKLDVRGGAILSGALGIGTTNPAAKLDVIGKIKITDGTQGVGKVLTSDADGKGSWQYDSGNYQVVCSNIYANVGIFWYNCCRMNTKNGETECKYVESAQDGNPWKNYSFKPFSASTESRYSLSCWNMQSPDYSYFWYNCCRTNSENGDVKCRYSSSVSQDWVDYASQPSF